MDIAVKNKLINKKETDAMDTLYSLLDKGTDDMQASNEFTFDEAFRRLEEA